MEVVVETGGLILGVDCALPWLSSLLAEGAAGEARPLRRGELVDVQVTVEPSRAPFPTEGWPVLARGAWARQGEVVIEDACSSGVDLALHATGDHLDVRARWRPTARTRAVSAMLPGRTRLLLREVLLQYPVLWWAGRLGRAVLHASVCRLAGPDGPVVLLAGPGGVGKSTVVHAELAVGAEATCDNLCVSDGRRAWGVTEPLRVAAPRGPAGPAPSGPALGRRVTHGRVETLWPGRVPALDPTMVVVLRRGGPGAPGDRPVDPDVAWRALVAGTYMAGELRRFWGLAATLALGTGLGAPHPRIDLVARRVTDRLPCREVVLGPSPGRRLGDLLGLDELAVSP
jgi:hypothetical protein